MSPNDTPSRAAIYARVSLDRTGEGASVDRQLHACRDLAMRRGWTVVAEYVDNSVSASKPEVDRPRFNALMADLRAGSLDAVMAWAPDRLTRQTRQMLDLIDLAAKNDFQVVTVQGDLDLSSPQGRLFASMAAQFAQMEAELKGERHTLANVQAFEAGKSISRQRLFGYMDAEKSALCPVEAQAIRDAYSSILMGQSLADIARAWTRDPNLPTGRERVARAKARKLRIRAEGMAEPDKSHAIGQAKALESQADEIQRTAPWTSSTVSNVLYNPAIAGIATYRRVPREDIQTTWTPIVSKEEQETLKAHIRGTSKSVAAGESKRGPSRSEKYLLSGILHCGHCGRTMTGADIGAMKYVCSGKVHTPACYGSIRVARADREVTEYVITRLSKMTARDFVDPEAQQEHSEILESLAAIEEERQEALSYEGAAKTKRAWLTDLDTKEREARHRLAEVVGGNVMGELMAEVLPHRRRNEDGPGYRFNLKATADNVRRVEAKWQTLSFTQKRQVIAALGTYTHSPQGRGKPATVAIEPAVIDSTKVKQWRKDLEL